MQQTDNRPVGVFDSGFGGISVLAAAAHLLPDERFIYYGDNLHAPYGSLPEAHIMAYTRSAVQFLTAQRCKAIVIACNTATSVAAAALRREMDLPIIAMEPALKPASQLEGSGRVLVMATEVTLKLEKFKRLMDTYGQNAIPIPAPKLVPAIESGLTDGPEIRALLTEYLSPHWDHPVKAVVLGCTHYVFLKPALRALLPAVPLIDGNEGTAKQLQKRLAQEGLLHGAGNSGEHAIFYSSKDEPQIQARMQAMFSTALRQLRER